MGGPTLTCSDSVSCSPTDPPRHRICARASFSRPLSHTSAALTLSLSGPFQRQGTQAADGVRLWAEEAGVRLTLADDGGAKDQAVQAYTTWFDDIDLLLGPYGSGLVRAVAPLARQAGRLLWNHGGLADDLAQPLVASLPSPASSYFHGVVDAAAARGITRLVVAHGPGPHARAVADGAAARAKQRELEVQVIDLRAIGESDVAGAALLLAGRFEQNLAAIRALGDRRESVALLAAVAAGIHAFGEDLGEAAEGVLGPVHWWPSDHLPGVGPSGAEFAARYRERTSREPSYVAALVTAAGYLAHAAHQADLSAEGVRQWRTSTLLGDFALDEEWRQVGHRMTTIRWQDGRMSPLDDDDLC